MPNSSRHYFKELRLQQFRALLALAHSGTFSAAATALGLTRATVWQQLRSLETEMETTLLLTRKRRVEFTAAGQKLVEIVAPLVAGFDSVKSALQASVQDETGQTLAIASAPNFLIHELRRPIARLHKEHPSLLVTFLERNSPAAVELLERGEADVAIVARPESVPARSALDYIWFNSYPFTLICPPDHPLSTGARRPTLQSLLRYPLILPAPVTYCRQHFDTVIRNAGLSDSVTIALESSFPVMLMEYVRMGLGVGVSPLPRTTPAEQPEAVALRDASHLFGDEPIYYVRRKGEFETPHAARFRALVTGSRKA